MPLKTPEPERIARLPEWARDYINSLTNENAYHEQQNASLLAQLDLARGKFQDTDTNVRLEGDDLSIPLPADSQVVFQGKLSVEPTEHDKDAITIELTGLGGLAIIPDDGRIYVRVTE